eukprot:6208749-Pleurochrysis_carterae.AAC.1
MFAAVTEIMLLLRWNSILFSETIFDAPIEPPLAAASAESCFTTASGVNSVEQGESSRPIGGTDTLPSNKGSKNRPKKGHVLDQYHRKFCLDVSEYLTILRPIAISYNVKE